MLTTPVINLHNDWEPLDEEQLRLLLQNHSVVALDISLPSIGYTNSYLDICDELREAAYVCEFLSKNFECTPAKRFWDDRNNRFQIIISRFNPTTLANTLIEIQWAIKSSNGHTDEFATERLRNSVEAFEASIHDYPLANPNIVDDFFANKIGGAYYEIPAALTSDAAAYPEHALGFWRSPYFAGEISAPFQSLHTTIIPKDIGLTAALERIGGPTEFNLLNAQLIIHDSEAVFLCEGFNLSTPSSNIHKSLACLDFIELARENIEPHDIKQVSASETKDFAVIETSDYTILVREVSESSPSAYSDFLRSTADRISSETFLSETFEIDWSKVDDETFEEICYDIIYQTPSFDRSTIVKMGKSRSRDGGRDIVIHTSASAGSAPEKYIFQCKAIAPGRSLTTSNMGSVSDVIDQYGAAGYGVMTTGLIDATLFDRLEAITKRRNVKLRHFSRMEIERFLAGRPALLERYAARISRG